MSDEAVLAAASAFQWVNMAISIIILALLLAVGYRWRGTRPYAFPVITLALHSVIFYFVVLGGLVASPSPANILWSSILRAHCYVVILGYIVVVITVILFPRWPDDEYASEFLTAYQRQGGSRPQASSVSEPESDTDTDKDVGFG